MAAPTPLPAQLRNRDHARLRAYAENLAFYNGNQWEAGNPRRERRLTFNYAKTLIQKTTSYLLLGRTNVVEPDDQSDAAHARAAEVETALAQVADQNALDQLDFDTELDAAIVGDAAYKVFWDPKDNRVRVTAPDPAGLFAWHWPDDPSRLWRVANRYTLDPDGVSATLGEAAASVTLKRTNTVIEAWTVDTYQTWIGDKLVEELTNPYGFIPYVLFPNLREPQQLWGTSDVPPIKDAQRELNRAMTQLSRILELSGNPIAVLQNVKEAEDINVRPGAVWTIPPDAKAYLLDLLARGGVKLHIDYIDALYRTLHDLGETPRAAFGGAGNNNLSGVAMQLELDPLVKKVQRKRTIRTDAYRARNTMILQLLDAFAGTTFGFPNHTVAWGSILPTDHDRMVQNEKLMVDSGIHSRHTAADNLGGIDNVDAEFDSWIQEEATIAAGAPAKRTIVTTQ
jgi:hypothetical protein